MPITVHQFKESLWIASPDSSFYRNGSVMVDLEDGSTSKIENWTRDKIALNSKPKRFYTQVTENRIAGFGDLTPDEYQTWVNNFRDEHMLDEGDCDSEPTWDTLENEYKFKTFERDHPRRYELQSYISEIPFNLYFFGEQVDSKYITPIRTIDPGNEAAYHFKFSSTDAIEYLNARLPKYGYAVIRTPQLQKHFGRIEGHVWSRRLGNAVQINIKLTDCDVMGDIDEVKDAEQNVIGQMDEIVTEYRRLASPAKEIEVVELVGVLRGLLSRANKIKPMKSSSTDLYHLKNAIDSHIRKLTSDTESDS